MKYEPGTSISHGTLRAEDLIPAFIAALPDDEGKAQAQRDWEHAQSLTDPKLREWDMDMVLEELFFRLDSLAPEGCYFGAHPGDGSDFGFWPVED